MKVPSEYTKLCVSTTDSNAINPFNMGYLCGKHNVFIEHMNSLNLTSAGGTVVLVVKYDKKEDVDKLVETKDFNVRRIFKHASIRHEEETKLSKSDVPVYFGFALENAKNLLGMISGKKHVVGIRCTDRKIEKVFIDAFIKISQDLNDGTDVDPGGDIKFTIRVVRTKDRTHLITWVEGPGFTNRPRELLPGQVQYQPAVLPGGIFIQGGPRVPQDDKCKQCGHEGYYHTHNDHASGGDNGTWCGITVTNQGTAKTCGCPQFVPL